MDKKRYMAEAAFDAMLKQALIMNLDDEIERLDQETKVNPPVIRPQFDRLMKKLFARERRKYFLQPFLAWTKRVAGVAALVFALLSASLMFVPQIRAAVVDTFIAWYDKFTQFLPNSDKEAQNKDWELSGLADDYDAIFVPGSDLVTSIDYINRTNGETIFLQYTTGKGSLSVDNEEMAFKEVTSGGVLYSLFIADSANDYSIIVWEFSGYRFCITAQTDEASLIALTKNILVKK